MILKAPDAKDASISELERQFLTAVEEKQAAIALDLQGIRAAFQNKREAAYLINFHLRHSQNTNVIHDLCLEDADGRMIHIDHLLIHHSYRFYILDSRHFSSSLKINDLGEFQRWDDRRRVYEPIPSPLEQNAQHVEVLEQVLESIGVHDPHIQSFVLASPHAYIDRPLRFDTELVVRADEFLTALNENLENASFLGLLTSAARPSPLPLISTISQKLIAMHRPVALSCT
jgi:hypothetical protein